MKKIWRYLLIILAVLFGIGCILGGLTLLLDINRVIAVVTQYKLPLISPSSQLWDPFIDPSRKGVTPQRYIYIYNITNPEDVCQGQIPNLVERGPYVYVRQRRKIEDTLYITPDKEYIEFQYEDQFIFNSSASVDATTGDVLLESDTFVFYNVALLVAAYRVRNMDTSVGPFSIGWIPTIVINRAVTECVSTTEDSDIGVLLHLSVQQYLWGYVDPLLVRVQELSKLTPDEPYSSTTSQVLFNKSIPAPDIIDPKRGQRCPLWQPQSECLTSTNSFSRVSTGYSNLTTVGQMKKFNGRENMPWWTGECAHFNGSTDGTQFQPQLTENTRPLLFVDALARTLELSYVGSSEVKGIKTLRFSMAPETFQSAKINSRNACFNQTIDGFLNLEPVMFAPLLVSQPYFLEADTSGVSFSFNNVTDGMVNRANKEQHAARIDIEPTSGAPMYLRVGVQINIPAGPIPKTEGGTDYYRETVPLHKSLVPAVMMYDQFEVSDQLVEEISKELSLGVIAHQIGGPFLIASGGLALLVTLIAICFPRIFCRCCQNSEISKKPEGTVQNSGMVRVSINEHKKGVEAPPPKRYEELVKSRKYEKKGERH